MQISNLSTKRIRRTTLIVAAALAVTAGGLASGMASASTFTSSAGVGPQHARITGAAIPASPVANAATPAGLPSKQQQIQVLTAALATMQTNFKTLFDQGSPGPQDVFDYGVGDLWKQGIDGAGTTIAVIEGWDDPDIASVVAGFDKPLGLPDPDISTIFPNGPLPAACPPGMVALGGYGSCNAWEGELELDVISAHLMAPYAKIVISATPADSQEVDDQASQVAMPEIMKALEAVSSQHLADVMSISDGTGEVTYPNESEILANNPGELTAAANGVPVMVATGDCGVVQNLAVANAQCGNTSQGPDTATWDDSPEVTAVGGSVPNYSETGQRLGSDPVWHEGKFAEGAGYSEVFKRPSYQNSVAKITGSSMRAVPDITTDASDGTSEAAPMMAGILALATQWNNGHDLGPINPALYKIGPAGAAAGIADVVNGNNSVVNKQGQTVIQGFTAGPGYDVATGWGTLFAPKLFRAWWRQPARSRQRGGDRGAGRGQLSGLEHHAITLTPVPGGDTYVAAGGFLPGHPVNVSIGRQGDHH